MVFLDDDMVVSDTWLDDFNFIKEQDYMFSAEKAAKKNWEELFNNNIPEALYED